MLAITATEPSVPSIGIAWARTPFAPSVSGSSGGGRTTTSPLGGSGPVVRRASEVLVTEPPGTLCLLAIRRC